MPRYSVTRQLSIPFAILSLTMAQSCPVAAQQATTIVSAAPNPVRLGGNLTLNANPAIFPFTAATLVTLSPIGSGSPLFLCGLGGTAGTPGANGATLSIQIPTAPTGNQLLGRWNLTALNLFVGTTGKLPGSIRIVPGNFSASSAAAPVPLVSAVNPTCITAPSLAPFIVFLSVDGQNFDPNGSQAVVSYIYFVDKHIRFRTDFRGKDSRVPATMLFRNATNVQFFVDLRQIHNTGGDHFGLAGNYYVQVQNPNGKVSGGPMYFTVQPYHAPGIGHY